MEIYTWPGDRLKVHLSQQELSQYGIDPYNGLVNNDRAELFFSSLLWMVSNHFNIDQNAQVDAEINEGEEGTIYLIISFFDEEGSKMNVLNETKKSDFMVLFRFSRKEDLFALAERAAHHNIKGGMLIEWPPYYYLYFTFYQSKQPVLLIPLLEEYGEKAYVDPVIVRKKGKILKTKSALQSLASSKL
ncbi:adaptor protein MecA [Alteribacillus sp. YIM 98480]|uniref:adaptor protein MecA n=1 Tax=Alteribacillus sp. YIM 98480 TaxID=2606599 RepID=UPI00131D1B5A|nr:adaptor protein MecA [Alteribacillus sp. YIM 98480]